MYYRTEDYLRFNANFRSDAIALIDTLVVVTAPQGADLIAEGVVASDVLPTNSTGNEVDDRSGSRRDDAVENRVVVLLDRRKREWIIGRHIGIVAAAEFSFGAIDLAQVSLCLEAPAGAAHEIRIEARQFRDAFDDALRRIRIVDYPEIEPVWLALRAEDEPVWLALRSETDTVWLPLRSETWAHGPDFIVQVPTGLVYDEARLRALVNEYRLASKYYFTIETI